MPGQNDAREAVYEEIVKTAVDYGGSTGAAMVRDAAYAYRALSGGQQPGGVYVEVKS